MPIFLLLALSCTVGFINPSVLASIDHPGGARGLKQTEGAVGQDLKGACTDGLPSKQRRPNIVFIITDDQESVYGGDWYMPQLAALLAGEGANFTASLVNFALCCPSRATILAGQCAHNTGVVSLYYPLGGVQRYNERGLEAISAPLLLQQAGYRTGLVGKYLNGYGTDVNASYIPPGFERWMAMRQHGFYNWSASNQGTEEWFKYEEEDYSTDVITQHGVDFISNYTTDSRPFFLYLGPFAPHAPWIPARRHAGKLAGLKVPRVPSYNESRFSISQKVTPVINDMKPIDDHLEATLDRDYQWRAESMLAVDDQIAAVVQALEDIGQLDNTYIFYTSDNGFKMGARRKTGKQGPYEEDVRVPLYVRGPGVPRGVKLPHLISNTDFLPTWLELAGVADPYAAQRDGKSFAPLLRSSCERARSPDTFRIGMLIEKIDVVIGSSVVSTMVPDADVSELKSAKIVDVFEGLRPHKLNNRTLARRCERGSWNPDIAALCQLHYGDGTALDDDEVAAQSIVAWHGEQKSRAARQKRIRSRRKRVSRVSRVSRGPPKFTEDEIPEDLRPYFVPSATLSKYRHGWHGPYYALRIQTSFGAWKFISYPEGYELYDLVLDPWELFNVNTTAPPGLFNYLKTALDGLKSCRGRSCSLENVTELLEALAGPLPAANSLTESDLSPPASAPSQPLY